MFLLLKLCVSRTIEIHFWSLQDTINKHVDGFLHVYLDAHTRDSLKKMPKYRQSSLNKYINSESSYSQIMTEKLINISIKRQVLVHNSKVTLYRKQPSAKTFRLQLVEAPRAQLNNISCEELKTHYFIFIGEEINKFVINAVRM